MPKSVKTTNPDYSVHPSVAHAQAILANLPGKTGRSLDDWVRLVKTQGPIDVEQRRDWLKTEHEIGGTTAWLIAERSSGQGSISTNPDAYLAAAAVYVEAMYSGEKEALRPIHDALIDLAFALGGDVRVSPCKTIVPIYRRHVIAEIKPATRDRLDLGIALKNASREPIPRLVDTGGVAKGDRISHKFELRTVDEVDEIVEQWLRIAYELDAAD